MPGEYQTFYLYFFRRGTIETIIISSGTLDVLKQRLKIHAIVISCTEQGLDFLF